MSDNQVTSSKQRPLMYISQPDFTPTPGGMQQSFVVKESTRVREEKELEVKGEVPKVLEEETNVVKEDETKRKKKKRFSEMDIEERIQFFINLPDNLPKTMCQITTKDRSYRGVILSYEEGLVSIKTLTSPRKVEIQLDDIEAINAIGF
ncbi:hypothetical protein IMZ08_15265 [Bacillus luteolus]|uniref:Spore coat protein CotO n=1 Tax=Litchfieldia luteola TaxID=682179 RepID=A0ABR9QLN7_9BACI|nr:CotO family spore coat protein [Cytobacillus luteolus]MBE4909410.1 hypothetical protein [Cytobacillus luteolus]MBP1940809.1 hypothetical protein [Cytobacillus luteolus]